jgi:hypothetical protein
MNITGATVIRWSGLAAIVAGLIFAGIQPIHPADALESVTTNFWAVIISLKFAMCFLFLLGITGIYARQVEETGWLGLAGFLLFSLSWFLQTGFVFTELFVLPVLAPTVPQFIVSALGVANGVPGEMNIGAFVPTYNIVGITYLLGGLLFGIAIFRARVMPRWSGGLLAVTALLTPLAVLLPHAIQRLAAIPMGISLIWLGYALWSERRDVRA